ncbi:hypothetical protein AABM34_03380 [Lysinibacillus fusiformis]
MNEIITSYNDYLNNIPRGVAYIATQLREDNLTGALKAIKDFSEGVAWLIEAGKLINDNQGIALLEVEKIKEYLSEINSGLEKQDFVLVADLFEYEIAPFFEEVKEAGSVQ